MRTFEITSSDVDRCPIGSLSPQHYREDGRCRCRPKGVEPQPGDVVRLDGHYDTLTAPGDRAVIDGSHYGIDFTDGRGPRCLAIFHPSAFRDQSTVSVSGGPGPLIPLDDLFYEGTTEQRFWRWKDRPRAGGGVEYTDTVVLWSWAGGRP